MTPQQKPTPSQTKMKQKDLIKAQYYFDFQDKDQVYLFLDRWKDFLVKNHKLITVGYTTVQIEHCDITDKSFREDMIRMTKEEILAFRGIGYSKNT
jgi:hypothetical protein